MRDRIQTTTWTWSTKSLVQSTTSSSRSLARATGSTVSKREKKKGAGKKLILIISFQKKTNTAVIRKRCSHTMSPRGKAGGGCLGTSIQGPCEQKAWRKESSRKKKRRNERGMLAHTTRGETLLLCIVFCVLRRWLVKPDMRGLDRWKVRLRPPKFEDKKFN